MVKLPLARRGAFGTGELTHAAHQISKGEAS